MVESLKRQGYIESENVEQAFRNVDRSRYVPEKHSEAAYEDRPIKIGKGQTISAPHMVAINTEILEPENSSRILEVGSGSGYQAAILSEIAEKVLGVEIEEELAERSRQTFGGSGRENVEIIRGVGLGPVKSEFDRILYSCAIDQEEFDRAKSHMEDDGKLLAPVHERGHQVMKSYQSGETENHLRVRFVDYRS